MFGLAEKKPAFISVGLIFRGGGGSGGSGEQFKHETALAAR